MDFDKNLGLYPKENYSQWVHMANFIDQKVTVRL